MFSLLRRSAQLQNGAGPAVPSLLKQSSAGSCVRRAREPTARGGGVGSGQRGMATATAASPPCLYKVLGVSKTATASQIKKAYMLLAREHHPDLIPHTEEESKQKAAHDRFATISAAFDTLGDTFSRQEYDMRAAQAMYEHAGPVPHDGARDPMRPWEKQSHRVWKEGAEHYYPEDEFANTRNFNKFKSAEADNFKFMSNTTVVVLACLWMVGGALMHFWRFGTASEEVRAVVDERSRNAADILDAAQMNAKMNGNSAQLERLREGKAARDARRNAATAAKNLTSLEIEVAANLANTPRDGPGAEALA